MIHSILKFKISLLALFLFFAFSANEVSAQTFEFTYQGRLIDNSMPANASYDFEFRLYDAASGGTLLGTQTRLGVPVSGNVFTVQLDFGAQFSGAPRWLEISVKPAGGGSFTTLTPRQPVTSAPYAIRSLNAGTADTATTAGNATTATNFTGSLSGNVSGTQSATVVNTVGGQSAANVASATQSVNAATSANTPNTLVKRDANGDFSGNIINATQYNIGGSRVLISPGSNLFVGDDAGNLTTTGVSNLFVGSLAGNGNTSGSNNAFVGTFAGIDNTSGTNNSFLGTSAGVNNTTGSKNAFVGLFAGAANLTGANNTIIGADANLGSNALTFATALGSGAIVDTSNTVVLGRNLDTVRIPGLLRVDGLGAAGSTSLCRNASNQISTCSSSLRYKTNIAPFRVGLSFINQLHPIAYNWKDGGMEDVGFGAEDVAAINPLFVNYNAAGEVEGVKYDRLSAVFVNAFKEQQAQIELQKEQNEKQQKQLQQQQLMIDGLKKLVCSQNPHAEVCKEYK